MSIKKWRRTDLATDDALTNPSDTPVGFERIALGLGCRGVSEECCGSAARMLEPKLRGLSDEVTGWMLDGIALILVNPASDGSRLAEPKRRIASEHRVFEGFSLELRKLDETVKVLNAYLERMRAAPERRKPRQLQ
jgi:hypothetical protein